MIDYLRYTGDIEYIIFPVNFIEYISKIKFYYWDILSLNRLNKIFKSKFVILRDMFIMIVALSLLHVISVIAEEISQIRKLHIKICHALKTSRREILFSLLAYEICLPYSLSDGSYFEKTTWATWSCCCWSESKVDLNEDPWL